MTDFCSIHSSSTTNDKNMHLVTELGESLGGLGIFLRRAGLGFGKLSSLSLLSFVVCGTLGFSALFESVDR